jgi:hypothetical protein
MLLCVLCFVVVLRAKVKQTAHAKFGADAKIGHEPICTGAKLYLLG